MSILLKDAMKIYPFSEAKLIAGSAGILREVVSANIQEVPTVERWLKGGEILFTAGYAFGNAGNGCAMMERLNEVGIAALAIKPGQFLPEIPRDMIDTAERIGLPLFELPPDLPYMDCIIAIFELITQEQLAVMRRVEKIHEMLTETILNMEGLEGICTILNRVTGNPVFITAPDGSAILASKAAPQEDFGEDYMEAMKARLEDFFAGGRSDILKRNQCNTVNAQGGATLVVVPICVQDEHIAHLVLDTTNSAMIDVEMLAFEQAGSMVAVEILNERAVWEREQKVREQLLEDLLFKRYSDEKMLIQRGHHLGFDITGKYCLFVIDADSFEEALKNEMLDLNEEKVQQIKAQVQQKICADMAAYHRPSLILDSSVGVVGMISVRKESDVALCSDLIDGIVEELEKLVSILTFSAGISRIKQGIKNVDQGRREAQLAMRAGRGMSHNKAMPHTHSFGDLGCLCFLCELSDSAAMRDFYEENMRALLDYDKDNNAELVKTLECYFLSKQNLRITAEALFVHKNSVIYRLGKIEALLGKELSDHQVAFDLQLCYKLRSIF